MPNARDLRLQADYEQVRALAENSGGRLVIESTKGHPPDEYMLVYHCRSIEATLDGRPVYRSVNRVRIKLPARYPVPSAPPIAEFQTPIFSPHVYPNRVVCMGSWQTTEYLEDIVLRIGAMMQFDRRYMSVLDPANEQAMDWVMQNLLILPSDTISFLGNDPPMTKTSAAKSANDLPAIGELMRQAGAAKEETFTGLTEETSLVWQDLE